MNIGIANKLLLILLVLAFSIGLVTYTFKNKNAQIEIGSLLQHATYLYNQKVSIPPFSLINHNQRGFTVENIRGKWTLWFFGFTHCPDICPITLGTLSAVVDKLRFVHDLDDVFIIFVSVDPKRDQPERLKNYVSAFNNKTIGVTANQEDLDTFLKNMGIVATKRVDADSQSDYTFDHSSSVFLIAPDTGISALFSTPHTVAGITEDFLTIRKYYN